MSVSEFYNEMVAKTESFGNDEKFVVNVCRKSIERAASVGQDSTMIDLGGVDKAAIIKAAMALAEEGFVTSYEFPECFRYLQISWKR